MGGLADSLEQMIDEEHFENMDYMECYSCKSFYQNLPDFASIFGNTLCVPYLAVDNIEKALMIALSEHNSGYFHNKFVSKSDIDPWEDYVYALFGFADLTECQSLDEKIQFPFMQNCSVRSHGGKFCLIGLLFFLLREKHGFHLKKDRLDTILIFSEKTFDSYIEHWDENWYHYLKKAYEEKGYVFPEIVFWNTESEETSIPIQKTETGITMINGSSSLKSLLEIYECLKN